MKLTAAELKDIARLIHRRIRQAEAVEFLRKVKARKARQASVSATV